MPPYDGTDAPREPAHDRSAAGAPLSDLPFRTTFRCVRSGCAMIVRLVNPIERCPRCSAAMATIDGPQLDLDEFLVAATAEIVAGFETLLSASVDERDDRGSSRRRRGQ
jgi:hypothetical protein